MAQEILIIGQSGTGKSTSLRNLDPKETAIINPTGKNLPFKGFKSNYVLSNSTNQQGNLFNLDSAAQIVQALNHINDNMPHIKNVILDDANYIMAFEFIKKAKETGLIN